jgi:hypothetical protein
VPLLVALLLALATFLTFWLIGLGLLAALNADTRSLRLVLAAPALGSATTILALFALSHVGVAMSAGAAPVAGALVFGSLVALALRRPSLPVTVLPVAAICLAALPFVGRPMVDFGFRWIANANDDMANYVLSATQLLDHGLLAPFDASALSQDRDYATAFQALHTVGARPGSDITLAAFSSITGRLPYEVFMPLIVAIDLCAVCGVASLALQAARRWWAAPVAAALFVASPLATYGVLQQLLPQVWGLALATALFALLMRPELHQAPGPNLLRDAVPIGLLAAGFFIVYIELASAVLLAYAFYLVVLAFRRGVDPRAVAKLWLPALAITAVVINVYAFRELKFVASQGSAGLHGHTADSPFGFALIPAVLPAILGFERLVVDPSTPDLGRWIVGAGILLIAIVVASIVDARRGGAAATVLLCFSVIAVVLAVKRSDFGLFKLYMYIQPFLAAAAGAWLTRVRGAALPALAGLLIFVVAAQLPTQRAYVAQSRNPVDLRHASDADLLPAFRRDFAAARVPVVAVTEHPVLAKLEAASSGNRPLHFVSADIFPRLLRKFRTAETTSLGNERRFFERQSPWVNRRFDPHVRQRDQAVAFRDNTLSSRALGSGACLVVLPSGSQGIFNRRSLPEGTPDLVARHCGAARNLLVFTESSAGHGFYFYGAKRQISFYQLEPDYFYPGRTFAGFGRYALFRVLDPSRAVRLEVNLTSTVRHDGVHRLAHGEVVGARRAALPLLGRGSARVFSSPVKPQLIAGQPYVLLDLGVDPRVLKMPRHGIQDLWSASIPLDPRPLTSYVRDVSLVSDDDYRKLTAPTALRSFPGDLADSDLEYSGIYEDGWTAEKSYVVLAGGKAADLVVRANVLPPAAKQVEILVDGRRVLRKAISPGPVELRARVPASTSPRRVELRFAGALRLSAGDDRPASALLQFLGVVPR